MTFGIAVTMYSLNVNDHDRIRISNDRQADLWLRLSPLCVCVIMWVGRSSNRILALLIGQLLGQSLLTLAIVHAELLPFKNYTTADGLARDQINRIARDSRGFLWFCTQEGLSRFDGYRFTNYTTANGLPNRTVTDLLETRSGEFWVATEGGVCQFNPAGGPPENRDLGSPVSDSILQRSATRAAQANDAMFVICSSSEDTKSPSVYQLLEDHTGVIWCATSDGLYRLVQENSAWTLQRADVGLPASRSARTLLEDHRGALWVGSDDNGLYRLCPNGRAEQYLTQHGLPDNGIKSLLEDRAGRLWVGTTKGLSLLVAEPDPARRAVARFFVARDGLGAGWVVALFQSSDGTLWIGTNTGLSEIKLGPDEQKLSVRTYTTAHGLVNLGISALTEDRDGNLWIGTANGGAMKMARNGFTTYGQVDGLGSAEVASIVECPSSVLYAISAHKVFISEFDGRSFRAVRPNLPKRISYFGWGWNQITFQDHTGEWWVATGQGLCRFPKVDDIGKLARIRPRAVYDSKNGLTSDEVFRLFEDSKGDIWITTFRETAALTKWERSTGKFWHYSEADGVPAFFWAIAFCEDSARNVWVGSSTQTLVRYGGGRFKAFGNSDGVPPGWVRALYVDHTGRLWIASGQGGLSRVDDTQADTPRFITYTTDQGLSSNQVNCITEDRWGRIYVGTGRGVDRLNPDTGDIKHYTAADGLIRGEVMVASRDRFGALWFGGVSSGLSRLVPEPDQSHSPPPILISGLRVAGVPARISELGETAVSTIALEPTQNDIQIEFVGLGFGAGEVLRYQYKLEGVDRTWGALTDQRTVNYASLSPGEYRFLVQSVSVDGLVSQTPASVTLRILPPIWQRWWFLVLAAMVTAMTTYAAYRYRVGRLIELERVRTRIASDLHDDIGSDLSRIALLSEVVRQQMGGVDALSAERLSLIASISRKSVDSMSDIVWAINPRRDRLRELTQRMRRLASDVLTARKIEFRFFSPVADLDTKLGADVRREIFLIFKEGINNIVRHSRCSHANIEFRIEAKMLVLKLSDDGEGFDYSGASDGHGLMSMRERAKNLGGDFEVVSKNGHGTTVTLRVPLKR